MKDNIEINDNKLDKVSGGSGENSIFLEHGDTYICSYDDRIGSIVCENTVVTGPSTLINTYTIIGDGHNYSLLSCIPIETSAAELVYCGDYTYSKEFSDHFKSLNF